MLGITTIIFPAMARADGGVYRVVVSTEFGTGVIAEELRKQEESFQVDVRGIHLCLYMNFRFCSLDLNFKVFHPPQYRHLTPLASEHC